MMESWMETGFTERTRGRMGVMGSVGTWLGVIFAVLGIISEAIDATLGLSATSWFLLAIASLLFGLNCWIGWAVGMYFHIKAAK